MNDATSTIRTTTTPTRSATTRTRTLVRVAALRRAAGAAVVVAVLAGAAPAPSTSAPPVGRDDPGDERPCFLVRPHWNTGLDGPAPTCSHDRPGQPGAVDAAG